MKKLVATVVASAALLVAAPIASAAGPPSLPPQAPQLTHVSCSVDTPGGTYSFSFNLPSYALTWFQQALARAQQHYPGLACSTS